MGIKPRPRPGLVRGDDGIARCWWGADPPEYRTYHDLEWGMPTRDDRRLFEKICLEGFQSGLSWLTILRKRPGFRLAFDDFDIDAVAGYGEQRVGILLQDAAIVRHRGKIEATIANARAARELIGEFGSLAAYVWQFEAPSAVRPVRITREQLSTMTTSAEAIAMSADLKRRGWRFVGPTTVYSFMQAMGLVNDHLHGCPARDRVEQARTAFRRPRGPKPSIPPQRGH